MDIIMPDELSNHLLKKTRMLINAYELQPSYVKTLSDGIPSDENMANAIVYLEKCNSKMLPSGVPNNTGILFNTITIFEFADSHIEVFAGCLNQPFDEIIDVYIEMCEQFNNFGINFSFNVDNNIIKNSELNKHYNKFVEKYADNERSTKDIEVACALMQSHGQVKH